MKKKLLTILTVIVMAFCCTSAQAADKLFKNLKQMDGLTAVYVGQPLLKMAGGSSIITSGLDIGDLVNNLDAIYVVNCDEKGAYEYFKPQAESVLRSLHNLNAAADISDDGQHVVIYTMSGTEPGTFSRIIIAVDEPKEEYTFIDLQGNIPESALTGLMDNF